MGRKFRIRTACSFTARAAGAARVEIPAKDQDFYALKNVPHGQLREIHYFSQVEQHQPARFRLHAAGLRQGHEQALSGALSATRRGRRRNRLGQPGPRRSDHGQPDRGGKSEALHHRDGIRRQSVWRRPRPNECRSGSRRGDERNTAAGGPAANFNFSAFEKVLIDDFIPFVDANFRTIADQPHRAMAGLSMGGMQTRTITLAHLDTFSHIGVFSGGSIAVTNITDMAEFKEKVKLVFVSYGSRELGDQPCRWPRFRRRSESERRSAEKAGINSVFYESPDTAHEWQSWRRSLHEFAPLLFKRLKPTAFKLYEPAKP